jgi:transmembrane sensor
MSAVDAEALEWTKKLPLINEGAREAFGAWVLRSPEHLAAFLRQQVLETELNALDPARCIDVGNFLIRAKASTKVVPWPGSPAGAGGVGEVPAASVPTRSRMTLRRKLIAAATAAFTVLLATSLWRAYSPSVHSTRYTTNTGQQQTVVLPDGSIMELNTESSVRVDFSDGLRNIYLLGGEAIFDVRHNDAIPFRVHANGTLIEDLGTQFSVHQRPDATTISVIEGVVRVSAERDGSIPSLSGASGKVPDVVLATKEFEPLRRPATVSAGEQASIVADGALIQKHPVDIAQATAWRHGRVVFSGATLEEIVAEFNRYNLRKIQIHGDSLRQRRYSGMFDARDPESFIDYLREDREIAIDDSQDGHILRDH